ncbi:Tetratricopeptide repeat protein 14 [Folsomia candida]|uniref:Tetratricopeptide repeat protein 14 n=1 Tax=Folsomia candida TaxID=158441 RepID=A0A226EPZ5_FOLCA|nr:Tetratricopeptide repeat protein 14 [Folsomia candida]
MADHHFSNSGGAPPRGILKNRDGNSSSRFSGGAPPEMAPGDPRLNHRNSSGGGNGETTNWMNVMQSGGGGLGPPGASPTVGLGSDGRLERSLNLKMNEFIARKKDLLFKPLTADEMPLAEVKGFQHNSEDHYGLVPSLDHYLHVDGPEIRSYFFQNLQVGDILIASVYTKNNSGINLKLLSTDGGKHIVLEDLGIKAFCPASHTVPPREKNDYEIGDTVRVEVLEVSADSEKLVCGMKGVTLSPEMQHTFHLGKISRHDFPRQFTLATNDSDSRYRRSYEDMLTRSSGFQNPTNIGHLASTMGILSNRNSLMVGLRNEFPVKEGAAYLRRIQNGKWAHGNVADGIKYFKMGKFTEAFQCLNKALSIDSENVEGLVARGALYANNAGFEKAIEDFEAALKFNPNHYNARKYLAETLVALGKQQETAAKLEDAVSSYSKCLAVKQDHKEARDALLSLFDRTNKLDLTKLVPPAALKAAELKERLKLILQTEMRMNLDGGKIGGKDKKSKRKKGRKSSASDDDSSTSSTSESESDSDSSDDSDKGKKRKKSKKSKKKKSKKSKKSREEARPMSLSPFSKRLVDPRGQGVSGSGLSGFNESSFSEWGQQLGLSQQQTVHQVHDSDDESKRSSKKSKDKKRSKKKDKRKKRRRNSSSSSESDSDDSARIKDKRKSSKLSSANTSLNLGGSISSVIPDLGDLEAKLSAYYSKIEHEKLEPIVPPQAVKITVERNNSGGWEQNRDAYNEPARKVEMKSNADLKHDLYNSGGWHDGGKGGNKIELRTDDYGNYIQPEKMYSY